LAHLPSASSFFHAKINHSAWILGFVSGWIGSKMGPLFGQRKVIHGKIRPGCFVLSSPTGASPARGAYHPCRTNQVEMGMIWITFLQKETNMKETKKETLPQPETFTPGITKGMVRQHAFQIYQDKLAHGSLTLEDWVLAEKDLVQTMQTDGVVK
jgi:hypothetical protein